MFKVELALNLTDYLMHELVSNPSNGPDFWITNHFSCHHWEVQMNCLSGFILSCLSCLVLFLSRSFYFYIKTETYFKSKVSENNL